jgi:cytochrome c-type biogenesis protein CcmH/NrfG
VRRRSLLGASALTALLAIYLVAVAGRGIGLIATGEVVGVLLGGAVLVLPLLGIWLLVKEWSLAVQVQRMSDELAARGDLPVDDLPRTPAGRIERAAADAAFGRAKAAVDASPHDWSAWFRLGFAYDAAGDRRRARAALRTAARLHRGSRRGMGVDPPRA